jgi:dipeptidyl aminopeptidase/acylaminoacyl peptidase
MFQFLRRQQMENGITEQKFKCDREGLTIRGTEYRPEGEHLPIAVVSHGFMATQGTVRHYARILAEQGYAAYCFDFNGGCVLNGKSDGKTTDMSVLTEVRDLEAVIKWAQQQPYTDEERVLLMGCSQGGFVSALTAAKQKSRIEKLVLFYPAFCIPDDARSGKMMFAKFDPDHIPDTVMCGPTKLGRCYIEDVIRMDPFAEIVGYPGDILIVHGDKDDIVDICYAQQAYETYQRDVPSGRRLLFETIKNGKHGFSGEAEEQAIGYLKEFARI